MAWLVKMLESAEPPISEKKFVAISAYNQAENEDGVLTWKG